VSTEPGQAVDADREEREREDGRRGAAESGQVVLEAIAERDDGGGLLGLVHQRSVTACFSSFQLRSQGANIVMHTVWCPGGATESSSIVGTDTPQPKTDPRAWFS
jgi:hypothetical protein